MDGYRHFSLGGHSTSGNGRHDVLKLRAYCLLEIIIRRQ